MYRPLPLASNTNKSKSPSLFALDSNLYLSVMSCALNLKFALRPNSHRTPMRNTIKWDLLLSIGVIFTLPASNIKGKTFEFAWVSSRILFELGQNDFRLVLFVQIKLDPSVMPFDHTAERQPLLAGTTNLLLTVLGPLDTCTLEQNQCLLLVRLIAAEIQDQSHFLIRLIWAKDTNKAQAVQGCSCCPLLN